MMRHLRPTLAAVLAAAAAVPLAAQAPRPATTRSPMLQSATFDVVAAFDERWRMQLEPLVFGRFSIGLSGSYTTQHDGFGYPYPLPAQDPCPVNVLCTTGGYGNGPPYRAWSVDLSARWYPAALSLGGRRQAVAVYLGEFVGYHRRQYDGPVYYGSCPVCASPQPADTLTNPPPPGSPLPYGGLTRTITGLEPGLEAGLRVLPARHVVIDVGGRFRLATLEDPMQRLRPGDMDSRLVVAVGVGW